MSKGMGQRWTKCRVFLVLCLLIFFLTFIFLYRWTWDDIGWVPFSVTNSISITEENADLINGDETATAKLDLTSVKQGSSQWQKVTWRDIMDTFYSKTLDTCDNRCVNPPTCSTVTALGWHDILHSGSFVVNPLLSKGQYIYEFEKDYMSYPPLEDMKQLPDVKLSKVTMFGVVNDTVRCQVGDTVTGRVDLVNGYGQPRAVGGDEVRVWTVDSGTSQYRSAGHVTDFNNGSYLITAWCLWPGITKVNVAVAYPREYIRAVIHQTHLSVSEFLIGNFAYNNTEEATICWSLPNVVGRSCVCNLTDAVGQSFYCGRPLHKMLKCDHWTATYNGPRIQPAEVTTTERELIRNIPTREILKYSIPHSVSLSADNKGKLPELKPCSKTSLQLTWDLTSGPEGFWGPNVTWTSLKCRRPELSHRWAQKCLKGSQIWFFGDSNTKRMLNFSTVITNCTGFSQRPWPPSANCSNRDSNISITFMPHEQPLHQHEQWIPKFGYKRIAEYITSTPSVGRYVFVIHYFLHTALSHLSVVHSRLRSLRDAVLDVVRRNPDALFAFRGPHVMSLEYEDNHAIGCDNLGKFYSQIIRDTFRDLRDKILYLDGWGMTVALENPYLHPTNRVAEEMVRTLLSFRCDENGYVPRV